MVQLAFYTVKRQTKYLFGFITAVGILIVVIVLKYSKLIGEDRYFCPRESRLIWYL